MEARVRSRQLIGGALVALAAGCGDRSEPVAPAPEPPPDTRAAAPVLDAILARAHGERRGTFDRVVIELREAADGPATTIAAALPERLRATGPDGTNQLVDGDGCWTWSREGDAVPAPEADARRLRRLRDYVAMFCLLPLDHASDAVRASPTRITFDADGSHFELDYDPRRDAPVALDGPAGRVEFVELFDSGVTLIPTRVVLEGIGQRHVRFVDAGVPFDATMFALPNTATTPRTMVVGGPAGSAEPRVEEAPAVTWLMLPDPGDWRRRLAIYRSAAKRLGAAGYGNGGDPILIEEAEANWFVVPYLPVRDDAAQIEPGDGERVHPVASAPIAAVDAAPGAFEVRIARAREKLDAFLTANGLAADGALRVSVNLIGRNPAEEPECLRDAPMRVAYPLRR